jgi:hypothetical protein
MGVKVNSDLKSFFETGDQPSQTEFGHLIDSMLPTPVLLDDANVVLNRDNHQGRTLIVPNVSVTSKTYTIPDPIAAGEHYHFIYGGNVAEVQNHIFQMASALLVGAIQWINNTSPAANGGGVWGDASNDTRLTVVIPEAYDIHFLAASTTQIYVWGFVGSQTTPAFS